jgi:uncharacterized protein (TIGR00251 family)
MNPVHGFLTAQPGSVTLALKVQPRARKNAILGSLGSELRISLTAPPVDDAANEALVRFLADHFGCGRNQIEIIRGRTSRHKTVRIRDLPVETVLHRLVPTP